MMVFFLSRNLMQQRTNNYVVQFYNVIYSLLHNNVCKTEKKKRSCIIQSYVVLHRKYNLFAIHKIQS